MVKYFQENFQVSTLKEFEKKKNEVLSSVLKDGYSFVEKIKLHDNVIRNSRLSRFDKTQTMRYAFYQIINNSEVIMGVDALYTDDGISSIYSVPVYPIPE
tara:strand:- start:9878 stop:10177 length:300 start_codon:yes stop_codon:yes gene_type:complete